MRTNHLLVPTFVLLTLGWCSGSAHAQYWYSQERCQSFYSVPVHTSFYVSPRDSVYPTITHNVPAYSSYYPGANSYYLVPSYPAISNYSPTYSNSYYIPAMPSYSSYYAAPRYYYPPSYSR
jgi:hypothetical protein